MTRTSIQALVICTGLSLISAMPFLDTDDELQKYKDDRFSPLTDEEQSNVEINPSMFRQVWPTLTKEEQYALISKVRDIIEDNVPVDQELTNGDIDSSNGVYGSRAKRLGFGYFPFSFAQRFQRGQRTRRVFPKMFVATRGKRGDYDGYNGDNYYSDLASPAVKRRRLGFTALRGR